MSNTLAARKLARESRSRPWLTGSVKAKQIVPAATSQTVDVPNTTPEAVPADLIEDALVAETTCPVDTQEPKYKIRLSHLAVASRLPVVERHLCYDEVIVMPSSTATSTKSVAHFCRSRVLRDNICVDKAPSAFSRTVRTKRVVRPLPPAADAGAAPLRSILKQGGQRPVGPGVVHSRRVAFSTLIPLVNLDNPRWECLSRPHCVRSVLEPPSAHWRCQWWTEGGRKRKLPVVFAYQVKYDRERLPQDCPALLDWAEDQRQRSGYDYFAYMPASWYEPESDIRGYDHPVTEDMRRRKEARLQAEVQADERLCESLDDLTF